MACMYPRHFPDIPIFWDDTSWAAENEDHLEATRVLEKPVDKSDGAFGESLYATQTDDGNDVVPTTQTQEDGPNSESVAGNNGLNDDDLDDDDDDDAMDDN